MFKIKISIESQTKTLLPNIVFRRMMFINVCNVQEYDCQKTNIKSMHHHREVVRLGVFKVTNFDKIFLCRLTKNWIK